MRPYSTYYSTIDFQQRSYVLIFTTVCRVLMEHDLELNDNRRQEYSRSGHLVGRRSLLQLLTALGGVGALSSTVVAQDEQQSEQKTGANDQDDDSVHPVGTEELLQYLAARYGDLLTQEEISELEDEVAGNIENAQRLDTVDLENGDDMALVFEAYRGEW